MLAGSVPRRWRSGCPATNASAILSPRRLCSVSRWRERYEAVDYHRAIDMLESLGAEHLANRTYGTLSEGERKRYGL